MRYPIMSHEPDDTRGKRLRVPAALAVAFVGSSAAISAWYGGCHPTADPPLDAGFLELRDDANLVDDSSIDASIPDDAGAPDAPRDATVPPPPPDAPDGPDH
jgi:hypothetical protein